MTLPSWRLSRPLARRITSSAWSHGTLTSRRVTLPPTLSATTRFFLDISAMNCSAARAAAHAGAGGDGLDRRGEVQHVQVLRLLGRQLHVAQVDDELVALAAHVGIGTGTAEAHQHAALAVRATAEIDAGDRRAVHRRRQRL